MGLPGLIQKYGGEKMGKFLTNIVDDINPIHLDRGARVQKDPDLYGNLRGVKDLVKKGIDHDSPNALSLSDYFKGKKIEITWPALSGPGVKETVIQDPVSEWLRPVVNWFDPSTPECLKSLIFDKTTEMIIKKNPRRSRGFFPLISFRWSRSREYYLFALSFHQTRSGLATKIDE